uniref:Uncharacterized protein n=1 Tax=Canis lupus familiaris TaxID=9615 RepID=A0A8P0T8E4_CANLF
MEQDLDPKSVAPTPAALLRTEPFPLASLCPGGALNPLPSLLQGKGVEETYWLVGKAGFPGSLPTPLDIKPGDPWQDLINQEIRVAFDKARQSMARPGSLSKAFAGP